MSGLRTGPDGEPRCWWALSAPEYLTYHDEEWGVPVREDRALYERLCLEAFQSGLSWLTILRRREAFRSAFAGFDVATVAGFGEADLNRLLGRGGAPAAPPARPPVPPPRRPPRPRSPAS